MGVKLVSVHPERKVTENKLPPAPGRRTHPSGHTAEVYQEKRYWQSAVSWLNSGIPSFTKGSQWKKMVEETVFVLSFPHLEDEENTTSRSPSVRKEGEHTTQQRYHHYFSNSSSPQSL